MSTSINMLDKERLRTEIAILQEDVPSNNPGIAKFKIPILITESINGHISITANTSFGKRSKSNIISINSEDTIKLRIPTEYTYFYGAKIVPAGTRFIVTFVGANVNDIKIIGRYDYNENGDKPYHELGDDLNG